MTEIANTTEQTWTKVKRMRCPRCESTRATETHTTDFQLVKIECPRCAFTHTRDYAKIAESQPNVADRLLPEAIKQTIFDENLLWVLRNGGNDAVRSIVAKKFPFDPQLRHIIYATINDKNVYPDDLVVPVVATPAVQVEEEAAPIFPDYEGEEATQRDAAMAQMAMFTEPTTDAIEAYLAALD